MDHKTISTWIMIFYKVKDGIFQMNKYLFSLNIGPTFYILIHNQLPSQFR